MNQQELEFKIGEDENPATVELTEKEGEVEAKIADPEPEQQVEVSPVEAEKPAEQAAGEDELGQYSEKVKKRIDKMTAKLRESQRREQAALEYAKNVQLQAQELQRRFQHTDGERIGEAKNRVETQALALKQIIKKAREEGDMDTEVEAQERLTTLLLEQRRIQEDEQRRNYELAVAQQQQQAYAQQQQRYYQQAQAQQAQVQQSAQPDQRAEDWAERNEWYGKDVAMTHAAQGIHVQLVTQERFDPSSDEYYDELDRRMRDAFPHKFQEGNAMQQTNSRANRPVQTVAPASRSSGVNNVARRTVKLTPSQVAIAKKLGVPLEEYAKYVKE